MAGNGVVLKPASLTPLIGERIRAVFERAGVPEGLVRVVHGPGTGLGARASPASAKVFFTGSRRDRARRRRGVRAAAEGLGARARRQGPDDRAAPTRNLEHAIAGALWGGFANAGQTCSGIERVYVMREVAERFIAGVVEGAQRLRVGDPLQLGHRDRADGLARAVRDRPRARRRRGGARGATLRCGGPRRRRRPGSSPARSTRRRC